MEDKIEVFILFDKEDRDLFLEFKKHLAPLAMQGLISIWDEDQIIGGIDRRQAINSHLQSAPFILLLLSARFMASHETYDLAKKAMKLHVPPHGYVIPVLLHEVDWEYSDFGQLVPLPASRKPIGSSTNRHAAFVDVVKGLRAILEVYKQSRALPSMPVIPNSPDEEAGLSDSTSDQHPSFDVFLCHNSKDKDEVKKIAKRLQARGIRPWLDEWELPPGQPWQPLIEEQIAVLRSAAVFVSKNDMGPWQKQELYALLRQFVQRGSPVIPVLLESAPVKPDLPPFLANMTWVDFRKQEPDPLSRLIWGITKQKPDFPANYVVTIIAPDDGKYIADVPADTRIEQLLRDFLGQWQSSIVGAKGSMRFQLSTPDAPSLSLDYSSTLREAGLAAKTNLTLVSKAIRLDEPICLTVEDNQGNRYVTTVLANTIVSQLADAFLRTKSSMGNAVVEWIVSETNTKQLQLEESLQSGRVG